MKILKLRQEHAMSCAVMGVLPKLSVNRFSVMAVLTYLSCNIDPLRKVSECLIKIVHKYINMYIYIYVQEHEVCTPSAADTTLC
jgi:hypothetical protein